MGKGAVVILSGLLLIASSVFSDCSRAGVTRSDDAPVRTT
jgi:hypothetical protein